MAHTASFDTQALDDVARQIGELIGDVADPTLLNAWPIELRETFEVWTLGLDALVYGASTGMSLAQLAHQTGRWHHQIMFGGSPAAFARSFVSPEGEYTLQELFVSPLAALIDQSIDWIDQNAPGDPLVSLLVVPAYYLHALWLTEDASSSSRILMVDVAGVTGVSGCTGNLLYGLQTGQLHEALTFVQTLAQVTPSIGVLLGTSGLVSIPAAVP